MKVSLNLIGEISSAFDKAKLVLLPDYIVMLQSGQVRACIGKKTSGFFFFLDKNHQLFLWHSGSEMAFSTNNFRETYIHAKNA